MQVAGNFVNESRHILRRGLIPKFSDFEILALNDIRSRWY